MLRSTWKRPAWTQASDSIIEIGAVRFQGGRELERFDQLVKPPKSIPPRITQITGIRNSDVADKPTIEQVQAELLAFVGSDVAGVIAHSATFDIGFLKAAGIDFHRPVYDTLELSQILLPGRASYSLGELCPDAGHRRDAEPPRPPGRPGDGRTVPAAPAAGGKLCRPASMNCCCPTQRPPKAGGIPSFSPIRSARPLSTGHAAWRRRAGSSGRRRRPRCSRRSARGAAPSTPCPRRSCSATLPTTGRWPA